MTSEGDSRYLQNIMKDLVGAVITKIGECDEDGFFNIHLRLTADLLGPEYILTPSCDPEGNGPGFLFIAEGDE